MITFIEKKKNLIIRAILYFYGLKIARATRQHDCSHIEAAWHTYVWLNRSSVPVIACRLFGDKQSYESMMTCSQLETYEQTSLKIE